MALKDSQPRAIRLADYQPPAFLIDSTELIFELGADGTLVTAELSLRRNPEAPATEPLRLDGEELELVDIRIDDTPLAGNEYRQEDDGLTLFTPPDSFRLRTMTRIHPETNTALEGLYKSGGMFCTQCEAEGFRRMTYYLDRPDVMARFRTTIIGDGEAFPVMLSNGNEVERETLEDGRTRVVWEDPFPKPAYLFALVAGTLEHIEDRFTTCSGRQVTLRIYTEPHNIDKVDYAMDALKRAMRWDEEVYGREYDLDIFMVVAVDDFNMGAMENKGLNIFNTSCVLASPDTTTDAGYQRVEAVVAHEYFHNWTGNRITCRDWFQLSLKEGFTVLRDSQFSADQNSPTMKRIEDVNILRTMQFAEDAGPMAHPVRPDSYIDISNFYTLTVYEKGAAVVGMIHTLLGPERFRKGSDLYFERHDGQAVTCDDFVQAMEDASGVDLSQFRRWYSQAGTPRITATEAYDDVNLEYHLTLRQETPPTPGQPEKAPFHIPVAIGLIGQDGMEMLGAAGERNGFDIQVHGATEVENPRGDGTLILHLKEAEQTFRFTDVRARPVLSLLRDFSAPVRVSVERDREDLVTLLMADNDGFARWDAAQSFFSEIMLEVIADPSREFDNRVDGVVGRLLEEALEAPDDGEARALLAALLTLPAEEYLAQQMEVVDVDRIHATREALRSRIGERYRERLTRVYEANSDSSGYRPDAAGFARRSLRNLALAYLTLAADSDGVQRCEQQYHDADNMTDRLSALRTLVWSPLEQARAPAETLLADFLERYRHEALVVDQWFATQALAVAEGQVDRVRALTGHPAFDARNPNKLRAVVGAFCNQNPVCFHAADGSGYDFLAEWVLKLNSSNPQVGARLLAPLTRWQRYDSARQKLMRTALERIAAEPELSRDIYEVVSKSLAEA